MSTEPQPAEEKSVVEVPRVDGITATQFTSMGNYLMQGMNETEAAILAGIDKVTILVMRRNSPEYNNYVEKKKLEFKRKHLSIISQKSDPRISQWLLERLTEDFSTKGVKSDAPPNVIAAIIKDIQEGGDESELSFAYKESVHGNSESQGAQRSKAEDRIRNILS